MDAALNERFMGLIDEPYKVEFRKQFQQNPNMHFRDAFQWYLTKYVTSTEKDRTDNRDSMKKEWTFGNGLEVLINQIEDARLYATFTGSPINDVTAVDTAVGLILRSGLFANEYTKWTACDAAQKS